MLSLTAALFLGTTRSSAPAALAVDTSDTRLLASPAITEGKIAFVYADDIWVADARRDRGPAADRAPGRGDEPVLLARRQARSPSPRSYDGNVDVYVVPVEGGEPRRLTWHPGDDIVRGFTPDGKVLFASQRAVFSSRHSQFFTVGVGGGVPQALPIPTGDKGAISPDGKFLAYTPLGERFRQWKNYRGGTASRIWVLKLADLSHVEVPKPHGRLQRHRPHVDRPDGLLPLRPRRRVQPLRVRPGDQEGRAATPSHADFPVDDASAGAGKVIYEQAGYLHVFEPGASQPTAAQGRRGRRPGRDASAVRRATSSAIRSADISPTGKRVVLEYRGEIVTVPAKKGDPRNLTETPGVHERVAGLVARRQVDRLLLRRLGRVRPARPAPGRQGRGRESYALKGAGLLRAAVWSPDSKKIAFLDNARTLSWIDLATGAVKRVAAEPVYGPIKTMSCELVARLEWLAYTLTNKVGFQTVWLYSLDQDKSHPAHRRPGRGRLSRSSTPAASTSTSWPRPTPAR